MALEGEINDSLDTIECVGCSASPACHMPLNVYQSAAGYYIGRYCNYDGPYSRESDYFATVEAARAELELWRSENVRPSARDLNFHGSD